MPKDDNWQDAPPKKPTWLDKVRDFLAFTIRGRYFWVRDIEGGCGPVYATLDEAIQEARFEAGGSSSVVVRDRSDAVIEVLEVRRGNRYRRVWCSDPGLIDARIKTQPEVGVDIFPPEWVEEAKVAHAPRSRGDYEDTSAGNVDTRIQKG